MIEFHCRLYNIRKHTEIGTLLQQEGITFCNFFIKINYKFYSLSVCVRFHHMADLP